ncbi:uncharacterized protein LOC132743495 isoform X2 [Ruditapes philippinarum]|uniref:uncharacterized protein LOC132743495 isoform X2 n=1 Tax=Ruditapes philippinarum TaxID=129788 RepID=UPI00295C2CBF|nr:uncharacterized protein LOC132743495 isoform X2 [Ruditapes philippinarum]
MWLLQPHRLILFLGICIFLLGMFLDTAEAYGMIKSPSKSKKSQSSQKKLADRRRAAAKKKKQDKKQKSQKKNQYKPPKSKTPNPPKASDTKISVYRCPSEAVEMNCLSCKRKVYRRCPIASASKITKVQVLKEYTDSYGKCNVGKNENFGIYDGNNIWVDAGCRAKFLVCYDKGQHEPKTVNCICSTSTQHKCETGLRGIRVNVEVKVVLLWSFGAKKCKEGSTYTYNKDEITVLPGCSGTFRVMW